MTLYEDDGDRWADEDDDEREDRIECRHCGATGLHWQSVTQADGMEERSVLFNERGRRHVCTPNADDFGVVL